MCRMMSGRQFVGRVAYYCVRNNIEKLDVSKISNIWANVSNALKKEDDIIYYSPSDVYAISRKHPSLFHIKDNVVKFSKEKEQKYHIYFNAGMPKDLSEKLSEQISKCLPKK